jgi:ABC-2 type transport system ATP-binding protein
MKDTAMQSERIVFEDVSKFYGEVLGVNRVELSIPPGITSLVGPNGSGKTTLMNLMTGLVQPSRGRITVLGVSPSEPDRLFRFTGYCTQFDSFPRGLTGYQFVCAYLRLFGYASSEARRLASEAIESVGLTDDAHRRIAGYSKGMRQRIKLAQAIAHHPSVLILDEPLNGLDPLMRSDVIALFRDLAARGLHLIVSSHVLHEVDVISDQVIMLSNGYVIAEGQIREVRSEIHEQPMQIVIRCDKPRSLASLLVEQGQVAEVRLHPDGGGILVKTRDADRFYLSLNHIAQNGIAIESVAPADDDVLSVYEYLIGAEDSAK